MINIPASSAIYHILQNDKCVERLLLLIIHTVIKRAVFEIKQGTRLIAFLIKTKYIWRKRTPFKAMSVRTVPSSNGFLADIFRGSPQP